MITIVIIIMFCQVCLVNKAKWLEEGSNRLLCGESCQTLIGDKYEKEQYDKLIQFSPVELDKEIQKRAYDIVNNTMFQRQYLAKWPAAFDDWIEADCITSIMLWYDVLVSNIDNMMTEADDSEIGNNFLRYAVRRRHVELVQRLMNEPFVDPSFGNNFCIWLAAYNGYYEIVAVLLRSTLVNPNDIGNRALESAATNGHSDVVDLLLSKAEYLPKNVRDKITRSILSIDKNAIQNAARFGYYHIVEMLLLHGVDPAANGNMALKHASNEGHYFIVQLLLTNKHVDPTADRNMAIELAAAQGHYKVVRVLLNDWRVSKDPDDISELVQYMYRNGKKYSKNVMAVFDEYERAAFEKRRRTKKE